jgi:ATP-dependent helicase/nuclease subunit A
VSKTVDHPQREQFVTELDKNFSVIASAGSGKTRAITDRIVQIARSSKATEWLPQLVVVTYTNRAADEMQQRTRQQILEAGLPLEVLEAFGRAYFGTIHSFCVKLLTAHGHHLGLPANLELITDDEDLWNQFVQQQTTIGRSLSEENRRVLLRHVQVRQLMELARKYDVDLIATEPDLPCPDTSFAEVFAAVAQGQTTRTIPKAKAELQRWEQRWRETNEFVPWPPCASSAKDFVRRWRDAFRSLRDWVNACALCVVAEVQRDYRDFRLERGVVTYGDQIALAAELMRRPNVAQRIREKNYRVILDEAQDTDPQQFFVLLEMTRPMEATGAWTKNGELPPRSGHFCMVGDFQQSIYRDPSDLARYLELHQRLIDTGAANELKFSVTFRLDRAQLDFVNATFPEILNDQDGQVRFVELNTHPDILPGQVVRLDLGSEIDLTIPESRRAAIEARELAHWLQETGLKKLRANSWQQVAILCPRKAWLRPLRDALIDVGLPVEVQSESDREAENPAYAWLTALLAIMVDPNANYEIVGVLREVFGLSDDELARFSGGDGARFQIAQRTSGKDSVAVTLNLLMRIRGVITQQPLFSAVQEVTRMTQLRERLRSLPAEEFGDLTEELDLLLSAAAGSEARAISLSDFARNLRTNYNAIRETHPSSAKAIQLITAHKAKGSEWQAVILPFLTRKVWGASLRYPRLIQTVESERPQIVFDRTDFSDFEEQFKQSERQEMERLLYVALTRAKHTLVLAFDRQFFLNSRKQVSTDSQIKWLRADTSEFNSATFAALPSEVDDCIETTIHLKIAPRETFKENLGGRETGLINSARQEAARFIRTVNPSKFSSEEEPSPIMSDDVWIEMEPELRPLRIDNPATRYGVWWHQFVQKIPWQKDASSWDAIFEAANLDSPDRARSAREWKLLRETISSISAFGLANGSTVVRPEMPFFWQMDEGTSLEGIVDLALFEPSTNRWLILDWKTNRVAHDKIDALRAQYRPQLAAYAKVVAALAGGEVTAAIYSTANAEFLHYAPEELANEWTRLQTLPADKFFSELREDA